MSLVSCRTAGPSTTKDIGGSPSDVSSSSYVVYLTKPDLRVHRGECPSTNLPVNRNCPGLKDLSVLANSDYESGLRQSIRANRPGGAPTTPSNPAIVKTLEDKIARINTKLSAGGLSDAEKTSLQSQLADLNRQLQGATASSLTAGEQQRYDLIMQKLNAGQDLTLDEGEVNYQLAVSPFGGVLLGMTFVKIPAGSFMMGSPDSEVGRDPDEGPLHVVTLTKSFDLQRSEVTQSQWIAIMGSNPSRFQKSENCPGELTTVGNISMCPNNPVENVSWFEAQAFIQKLNAKGDGYRYRLPTEAQWEYAARAGTTTPHAGDVDAMAWYNLNSGYTTHPVAKKQANAWGLYDMHGNVFEWTADWSSSYLPERNLDPVGPTSGGSRVLRGGAMDINAGQCRSAYRGRFTPDIRHHRLGFRLLRTSP